MEDLFSIMDADFIYREVNASFAKALGTAPAEILGKHPQEIFGRGYFNAHIKPYLQRCMMGETVHHLIPNKVSSRPNSWFHLTRVPITAQDGTVIGIISHACDVSDLKEAELKLRESEAQLRDILDHSSAIIFLKDMQGRYLFCNKKCGEVMHLNAEEIIGKSADEVVPADMAQSFSDQDRVVLELHESHEIEERIFRDGTYRYYLSNRFPLKNSKGEMYAMCGISTDISELKETMHALEDSRERYRTIFENTGEQIIICDGNGRVLDANPASCKCLGYSRDELMGMPITELVKGDSWTSYAEIFKRLQEGDSIRFESEHIAKDKSLVPVELHLDFMTYNDEPAALCIGRDLRERKEAEKRLNLLGNAVEQVADSVMITSAGPNEPHPIILYTNKAFQRMTGYAPEELIGKSPKILQGPETDLRVLDVLRKNLDNGRTFQGETINYNKEGLPFTLEWRISPIELNGRINSWIAIMRDVSRRKRMEEEIIRSKDLAEEANRTKSRFLANMSHEIRTPLNGVLGMLQLLETTAKDEEQKDYIATAMDSGRSLLGIIDDLLDFSKVEAGKLVLRQNEFNLQALLSSLLLSVQEQVSSSEIKIALDIQTPLPEVIVGDDGKLRQVLLNIINNAVKFTSKGSISLGVSIRPDDKNTDGLRLFFTITDSGIGIPHESLEEVFEPFTQVDDSFTRSYQGSGLGLSIVKRLVELMDGMVHIESKVGEGTSVFFDVLMHSKDQGRGEAAVEETRPRSETVEDFSCNILVVEDNAINRLTIVRMLEKLGHCVESVEDGRMVNDALERGNFDLILMDVQMPSIDGIKATQKIRNASTDSFDVHIPIIALTAYALDGDREKCLAAGMNDYLSKPIDINDLRKTIRRILDPKTCKTPS
jgi:PAS domain S-box-containing protein